MTTDNRQPNKRRTKKPPNAVDFDVFAMFRYSCTRLFFSGSKFESVRLRRAGWMTYVSDSLNSLTLCRLKNQTVPNVSLFAVKRELAKESVPEQDREALVARSYFHCGL
jgi:hypothetical protein